MRDIELVIVDIAPPQIASGGDFVYRLWQPGAALGRQPGTAVASITNICSRRAELVEGADILVLHLLGDPDLLPIITARRKAGRPTVFEISDNFLHFQPSNPAAAFYESPENRAIILQLISMCDAVQTTVPALKEIFSQYNGRIEVFENRMDSLGDPGRPDAPVVVGWGGSFGHYEDMRAVAPALIDWLGSREDAALAIMGDSEIAALFSRAPRDRFSHTSIGSLKDYYNFVQTLHIGIAPLKEDPFNHCRSDVKFMEYASRGAVPVCSNAPTYNRTLRNGKTGFLFDTNDEMISILDRLASDPELRRATARNAFEYIRDERMEDAGARERLEFYRSLIGAGRPAGTLTVRGLRSIRQLEPTRGSCHFVHKYSPAELNVYNGLVYQFGHRDAEKAEASFRDAVSLEPDSFFAHFYLGNLLRAGKRDESEKALRRAAALYPLSCETRTKLAALLFTMSKKEEALELVRSVQRSCAEFAPAWFAEGEYLASEGRNEEAIPFFEKALAANPYFIRAAMRVGAHCLENGGFFRAEEIFRRVMEVNPRNVHARCALASALKALGRDEAAAGEYVEALRLEPDYKIAAEVFLSIPLKRYKAGEFKAAAELIARALEASPDQPELLFWMARATERAGGPGDAVSFWQRLAAADKSGRYENSSRIRRKETQIPEK
jgi:tetratricopeptide (TPR) repeat protein